MRDGTTVCLILFAWRCHPGFPLILAANRDEFYERPTEAAHFWEDAPEVLAGRDLRSGGTWIGVRKDGRFAAVTNYRAPLFVKIGAPSRGDLVKSFLADGEDLPSFRKRVLDQGELYNGFSLLVMDTGSLDCFSNFGGGWVPVGPGIHGLSNHLIDTPWPKVEKGKRALREILESRSEPDPGALFRVLADTTRCDDTLLPDTGIGLEWERILSSIFIQSPVYGTRSSTVLIVRENGTVTFVERSFKSGPDAFGERRFDFNISGERP